MRDLWSRNGVEIQVKLEDRDAGDISRDWRVSVVNAANMPRKVIDRRHKRVRLKEGNGIEAKSSR